MKQTKVILIPLLVVILIAGAFWAGKQTDKKETSNELQQLKNIVEDIYPTPTEIKALNGTIKNIVGARISLEVSDPNDYLPHTDGSVRKTEIRSANVLSNTTYSLIDYNKVDKDGNFSVTKISLTDLKTGDQITVRSNTNIKDLKSFDVIAVEKVIN
ncbi:MAG: hypothetical protein Q8L36_00530 [bacterium]|nr:hypothetical protein [bacterium]